MKIYVDEMPKDCKECPMCRSGNLKINKNGRYVEAEQCVFGQYKYQTIDDDIDTCPLQSLAEHDKQVRNELIDVIGKNVTVDNIGEKLYCRYEDLKNILYQLGEGVMSKEIKGIDKITNGTYLFTTYEKPLREQISDLKEKLSVTEKTLELACKSYIDYQQCLIENCIIEGGVLTDIGYNRIKRELINCFKSKALLEIKNKEGK